MESEVDRFQRSLTALNRLFSAEVMKQMDTQVTSTQMFMLHYIQESGRCRLTALADKLDVKPSAVTVMIDRLAKSGYVTRVNDASDRRVIQVELTQAGEDILARAHQSRKEIVAKYMQNLNRTEVEAVTHIMEKLVAAAQHSAVSAN
ncbi:MarR family transcriptional regulator [Paenibacillus sp. LHD-117]|uniref:MarR family winged helix-turn-helix transcriptional regulator n=1 Tax=Paenibacillus sp. LHD-117 TaxID=3071412 RepID=UPI0027DF6A3D|nr:MarR family transcriptional regulator [Paenibacillus sp. LHD-117]MDQ6418020.1 MarR family transcriptional regulator [Paenibacillus sp. LHD-117]